ncbi:rano class II histocompatibility antigen, A beta chain-like [Chanos chanos]|uniref:Rano class II histocompatibility antigen, A beta chain-like n=1 Tax=Chanos chanos TaxID=29144 RepID=A0A6J2VUA9_CHACN|nr:rano class II histocompatibility antigen, A beta chain-like [Chanos chanos]
MTGFYPPAVKVTWTKNNVNVTEGMTLGRYSSNSDGSFSLFSVLGFTPEEGDIYTCTVEHKALLWPLTRELDGYYAHRRVRCATWDMEKAELIDSSYFNKMEYLRYNSTMNKFTGYMEYGLALAEELNRDPAYLRAMYAVMERYCRYYGLKYYPHVNKRVQPEVQLKLIKQASGRHPAMLMCSAYDFYPKAIRLTWLKDGKEVTSDVTSSEEMADGDWYYQSHSHLEYMPKSGEKISCMVEHASFSKSMIYDWNPGLSGLEKGKIAVGACVLMLGMTAAVAGLIYHRKKYKGQWE